MKQNPIHGPVIFVVLIGGVILAGCARLPYKTATVYEGERVAVVLQREVEPVWYSHPVQLRAEDIASILRGFSIRDPPVRGAKARP